jgi:sugar O-acyltransferase (sialic acid O-acetyltransferase NeuD family)
VAQVVIFGTGDVAVLANYFLTHDSQHEVVAFCLDRERIDSDEFLGAPLVPFDDIERRYPPAEFQMLVAIGFQRVNRLRSERFAEAKDKGYALTSYVSSSTLTWPDLEIGENCIVMERNVIQPFVSIGNDVILGPGNCIGHHARIMDHAFLASCVDLSGRVTVGAHCFLGANAAIRENVTIGDACVIGANCTVLANVKPGEVHVSPRPVRLPMGSDRLPWLSPRSDASGRSSGERD